MTGFPMPADVATAVQRFLRGKGFNAVADVPLDRVAGTVRVSRTAGEPLNPRQEQARVLIEVWEHGQRESFLLARRVWLAFANVARDEPGAFPGIYQYETVPGIPVEFPDPYAELMSRHQFEVTMLVRFDEAQKEEVDGEVVP